MARVKFLSPIRQILGKLCKADSVYFRRYTRNSKTTFGVKRDPEKSGAMSPRRKLACDLMTFVSKAVSNELKTKHEEWEQDFELYQRDCNLFKDMRRFQRLRDYVHHILYVAVIEYFREELKG